MKKTMAFLALSISVFLWGLNFVAIHQILTVLSPLETNVVRFSGAALLLWLVQLVRSEHQTIKRKDMPKLMLAGCIGTAAYYSCVNGALLYVTPGVAGIASGAIPVITVIVSMLFLGMKTKFRNVALIGLSFAGIWILGGYDPGSVSLKGMTLIMIGNLMFVIYSLIHERLEPSYDGLKVLAWEVTFGAVIIWCVYLYQLSLDPSVPIIALNDLIQSPKVVGNMIFLSVFGTVLTYYLYNMAIKEIGATMTALFINVIPVVAIIASVISGVDVLTFESVVGGLMIVTAVFFLEEFQ